MQIYKKRGEILLLRGLYKIRASCKYLIISDMILIENPYYQKVPLVAK
jgi:hypothetical protein